MVTALSVGRPSICEKAEAGPAEPVDALGCATMLPLNKEHAIKATSHLTIRHASMYACRHIRQANARAIAVLPTDFQRGSAGIWRGEFKSWQHSALK
jgi:hypothetical protein